MGFLWEVIWHFLRTWTSLYLRKAYRSMNYCEKLLYFTYSEHTLPRTIDSLKQTPRTIDNLKQTLKKHSTYLSIRYTLIDWRYLRTTTYMHILSVVVSVFIGTHAEMLPQLIPTYLLFFVNICVGINLDRLHNLCSDTLIHMCYLQYDVPYLIFVLIAYIETFLSYKWCFSIISYFW